MNRLLAVTVTLGSILFGCATSNFVYGRDFPIEYANTVPFTKSISDTAETWSYMYTNSSSHAQSFVVGTNVQTTSTRKNMIISFKNDTVYGFNYSSDAPSGMTGNTNLGR